MMHRGKNVIRSKLPLCKDSRPLKFPAPSSRSPPRAPKVPSTATCPFACRTDPSACRAVCEIYSAFKVRAFFISRDNRSLTISFCRTDRRAWKKLRPSPCCCSGSCTRPRPRRRLGCPTRKTFSSESAIEIRWITRTHDRSNVLFSCVIFEPAVAKRSFFSA